MTSHRPSTTLRRTLPRPSIRPPRPSTTFQDLPLQATSPLRSSRRCCDLPIASQSSPNHLPITSQSSPNHLPIISQSSPNPLPPSQVISALPLPRTLCWAYLARHAHCLGVDAVAARALGEVQRALVQTTPPRPLWQQNPPQRQHVMMKQASHRSSAELRAAAQALLLAPVLRKATPAVLGTASPAAALDQLLDAQALTMALQLAVTIDDAPLAAAATQAVYTSLTPLLKPRQRSLFVMQPLCACLETLRLLGPSKLQTIRRAPHLLACVGFEVSRRRLEAHARGADD